MIDVKNIDQILDRADIVDIIGSYVELKKKGVNYEGCCPFHNEKTPSFKVNPVRNTYHCFGCGAGGNVISFVMQQETMTFPEAVRHLANKVGIHLEECKLTPEQEQNRMKRESMFVINAKVAEFFAAQIKSTEAKSAYSYAVSRWGKDYIDETQIGYAPDAWKSLCEFASKESLSIDMMLEMNLIKRDDKKNNLYDFYRNRVMIPIRDRYRRVIGFTARDISGVKEAPKYLNSAESDIYSKSNSIFGIDVAIRQAAKEDRFYCVEGAPDVMRMQLIGVNNTIASLGAAWTKEQFEQLKKYATRICFLPDADPPKRDESYGTGIAAVMKNGLLAMQNGFSVSVKEIPLGADNSKNDPDSYCTDIAKFKHLEEEDFIIWYAKYIFQTTVTTDDKSAAINRICSMLALIKDDVKDTLYLKKLKACYQNGGWWNTSIKKARQIITDNNAMYERENKESNS